MTTQKIKIWKCSHSSLITIFSTHAYCMLLPWPTTVLARWQRSFKTQNSVCKSRRICFPALWSGWINYVVIQHFWKSATRSPFCFTTRGVRVLFFLFLILCEVSHVHIRVQAKNSNGTTVGTFSNLIFCLVVAHSFSSFCSYIIMRSGYNKQTGSSPFRTSKKLLCEHIFYVNQQTNGLSTLQSGGMLNNFVSCKQCSLDIAWSDLMSVINTQIM